MPRFLRHSACKSALSLALVVAAVAAIGRPASPATAAAAEHVVLIGFDGFDPAFLDLADTPNLDAIAARGVHGVTQGVMLPITTPSFTSIATGTWPDKNGTITYYFDRATNTFHTSSPVSRIPTIANAVIDSGGTVGAAQYFAFRGHGTSYGDPTGLYTQPGGACSNMFDDAIAMLRREPVNSNGTLVTVPQVPTLLGVYCPHLDTIGHAEGAESPNLGPAIAALDAQVGRLMAALDDLGLTDQTTVLISGDHGMTTYTQRNTIPLNQALASAGYRTQMLLVQGQTLDPTANVLVVPAAGRATSLYLVGDLEGDADALADAAAVALEVEGVERVFDRDQQAAMHMNPKFGDLVIENALGWSSGVIPMTGHRGDHGSSAELDSAFFMAGAGVAPRTEPVQVCHVNIAPTIALLLGLPSLPDADGGALTGDYDNIVGCPLDIPSDSTTPPTTTSSTTTSSTTTSSSTAPVTSSTTPSSTAPVTSSTTSSTVPSSTTSTPTGSAPSTTAPSSSTPLRPRPDTTVAEGQTAPGEGSRPSRPARPVTTRPAYVG